MFNYNSFLKKLTALLLSLTVLSTASYANVFGLGNSEPIVYPASVSSGDDRALAFPGADGAGKFATGGRSGEVYHVTNLNDSGKGSFRDAVSKGRRIVVFDVGGTINLKSDISISGNITVMGQTAPGGAGVTVRNGKLAMAGDNIIVRYVASRPGEKPGGGDYDAWGGSKGSNSIIDHCSIGWANDEQFGIYSPSYLTVQYTIVGPANCLSTHSKGSHGFGPMIGSGEDSWHHNLICHNMSRNFRGKMGAGNVLDYVNNVIYGWGGETAYGSFGKENYVGNYFKKSISTRQCDNFGELKSGSNYDKMKFYLTGNKMVDRKGKDTNSTMNKDNWRGGLSLNRNVVYYEPHYRASQHFPIVSNGVDVSVAQQPETADEAFENVTSYAGAAINPASRTRIDAEVLEDARTGGGSLTGGNSKSSTTSDVKEKYSIKLVDYDEYYPSAITQKQITDSDDDGMPDEWELARGLNPNDASDASGSYIGGGYTNIEYYCNDLTVDSFPVGTVTVSPTLEKLGEDYPAAIADLNALNLPKNKVESAEEIKLPQSGSKNNSQIIWSSSSDSVKIKDNQITNIVQPTGVSNETAYLKADVINAECTLTKYFNLTVLTTTTSWYASESNNGALAGTKLMNGLTTMFDAIGGNLSSAVTIDGGSRSYYLTSNANGSYNGGVGAGTCVKYTAEADGKLYAYAADLADTKTLYIVPAGVDDYKTEYAGMKVGTGGTTTVSADVQSGTTYYIFPAGTKGKLVGVKFVKKATAEATPKPEIIAEKWSFDDIATGTSFAKDDSIQSNNGKQLVLDVRDNDSITVVKKSDGDNYLKFADNSTSRTKWTYTPDAPLQGDKVVFEFDFNKSDIEKGTTLLKVYDEIHANSENTFSNGDAIFELVSGANKGTSDSTSSDLTLTDYFSEGTLSTNDKLRGADFSISNFNYEKNTWYGVRLEYFINDDGKHEVALYTKSATSSKYTYRDSVILGSGLRRPNSNLDSLTLTPTKMEFLTTGGGSVTMGLDNISIGVENAGGDTPTEPSPKPTDSPINYNFIQNGNEVDTFVGGELICRVSGSLPTDCIFMVAEYNEDGALLNMAKSKDAEIILTPFEAAAEIHVFVWNDLDGINPCGESRKIYRK